MEFNLEEMLNKVVEELRTAAKTETVIGQPFKLGDFECVPVIKISMGFGSGGGAGTVSKAGPGKAGAAGAGIGLEPLGFLVSKGDQISLVSVSRSKGLDSVFEKIPDLVDKIIEKKSKKEAEG